MTNSTLQEILWHELGNYRHISIRIHIVCDTRYSITIYTIYTKIDVPIFRQNGWYVNSNCYIIYRDIIKKVEMVENM